MKVASSRGVTAIHDKDGWIPAIPRLWQELERDEALPLRVWQSIQHERLDGIAAAGIASGLGSDRLRLGYLKVFMDGTLGSQTALMTDGTRRRDHEPRGARRHPPPRGAGALAGRGARDRRPRQPERARRVRGDAGRRGSRSGLRHRIEHAQCLRPEDVGRFAELGLTASVQFSHAPSDEELAHRFWADRLDGVYSFRDLLDRGHAADQRLGCADRGARPLGRDRRRRAAALARGPAGDGRGGAVASTVAPAWQTYDERRRGKLLPGYLADLVVLDRDPLAIPAEELPEVQVVATMVGGRWTYARADFVG